MCCLPYSSDFPKGLSCGALSSNRCHLDVQSAGVPRQSFIGGHLKQQTFIFSQFWRLAGPDLGVIGRAGFLRGLCPWHVEGCPLVVFFTWLPLVACEPLVSLCMSSVSLLLRTPAILDQDPLQWPHFNLIITVKAPSPNTEGLGG